jgi:hypothetical protein
MEYVPYILIILGIAVLCLFLMPEKDPSQSLEKKTTKTDTTAEPNRAVHARMRETHSVPTPWGWPGHSTDKNPAITDTREVHNTSETMIRFVNRLLSEKQTVENDDYMLKKAASLKALLEDRYGRVLTTPETNKLEGKRPLVRRPLTTVGMKKLHEVKTPWGW